MILQSLRQRLQLLFQLRELGAELTALFGDVDETAEWHGKLAAVGENRVRGTRRGGVVGNFHHRSR